MGLFSNKSKSSTSVTNVTGALDQSQANRSLGIVGQYSTFGDIFYAPLELFLGSDAVDAGNAMGQGESFRVGKTGVTGNPVSGIIQSVPMIAWLGVAIVVAIFVWRK